MALDPTSAFPGLVDTFPTLSATAGDDLDTPGKEHDQLHNKLANAISALETFVLGIGGGDVNDSLTPWDGAAADLAGLPTDRFVQQITTMVAPRIYTLPAAASVEPGHPILFSDASSTVTGTNYLQISKQGADTIPKGLFNTSVFITSPGGSIMLVSDGVSEWDWVSEAAPLIAALPEIAADDPTEMSVVTAGGTTSIGLTSAIPRAALFSRLTADAPAMVSDIVLNDVTGLSLAVAASTVYEIGGLIIYRSATAADLKLGWTFPFGASGLWNLLGLQLSAATSTDTATFGAPQISQTAAVGGVGVGTDVAARISGLLVVGPTAGALQLQACQNTSDATNTIIRNLSFVKATKVG